MGNATERETDVWLTPKAEIMTHQSFQSGQNETAFVLSSPSGQEMLSELGNLSACPATMTTGSEVWGKTPESLLASVSSSVGDHQDPHLASLVILTCESLLPQPKGTGPLGGAPQTPEPQAQTQERC